MVMDVYSMTSKFHYQVFFSTLLPWEFMYLQIYHFKAGLGGEICSSDVSMQKGYCKPS